MHRSIARFIAPLGITGLMALAGAASASAQEMPYTAAPFAPGFYQVTVEPQVINHFQTVSFLYHCPNGDRVGQDAADNPSVTNTSSANVTIAPWINYDGSLQLGFTNWNVDGDQTYSFQVICVGNLPAQEPAPTPAPAPQPAPQQQPQKQADAPQVGLNQADFQAAYDALLQTLPPAPRRAHW
jgi:hypothetical protein